MSAAEPRFVGRVGLQQRVLPAYRVPFFDRLAAACDRGLSVFAGQPRPDEAIMTAEKLEKARWVVANNRHILSGRFYLCWQEGIVTWLETWNPDVLILEANPRYVSNWRAAAWMRARRRPVVGWGLGAPSGTSAWSWAMRWFWSRFLNRFDALLAYSTQGAVEYAGAGYPAGRTFVAVNAVESAPSKGPSASGPGHVPLRLLFVGRLQARKRLDDLIQACASLRSPVALRIVGEGPARQDLERLAADLHAPAEFCGRLAGAALEEAFAWADVFVLPGTGGLAVQQAMAHGLPVIVAEADGTHRDLVRPGENGWLIPPGDQAALVGAIGEAVDREDELARMGAVSYRIVKREVNLDSMLFVFLRALRAVSAEA